MRVIPESGGRQRLEGDDGALIVEMGLAVIVLVLIVFGVVDLGRAFSLQNRLTNAAREGAAVAQFKPGQVNTGCASGNNVVDRATNEDTDLSSIAGFSVTVAKKTGSTTTTYTGCGTPVGTTVAAGDTVVVTTRANFSVLTPIIGTFMGNTIVVTRTISVVVQG